MKKIALIVVVCTINFSTLFGVVDWYNQLASGQEARSEGSVTYTCVKAACKESAPCCIGGACLIKAAPIVCAGKCAAPLIIVAAMCCSQGIYNLDKYMPGHVPPAPKQQSNSMKRD